MLQFSLPPMFGQVLFSIWVVTCALSGAVRSSPIQETTQDRPRMTHPGQPIKKSQTLRAPIFGSGRVKIESFLSALPRNAQFASAGCLPLAYYGIDDRDPRVTELGVHCAEEIANWLHESGVVPVALGPSDLEIRLEEVHIDKKTLFRRDEIADHADRLGVDLVLYGTILRRRDSRRPMGEVLEIKLASLSLLDGKSSSLRIELPNYISRNRDAWRLAEAHSLWMPTSSFGSPKDLDRSFDDEIESAVHLLAQRVVSQRPFRAIDRNRKTGDIYVPPADSAMYVRAVHEVRKAQIELVEHFRNRRGVTYENQDGAQKLGLNAPFVWRGKEFQSITEAMAQVTSDLDSLRTSKAAMFGETISSMFIEDLRPVVHPKRPIMDVGFTGLDASIVSTAVATGELSRELVTGGLAKQKRARDLLRDRGVEIVVAPKLEQVGRHFSLRVEIYDLVNSDVRSSTSTRIDARFSREIAKGLGVELVDGKVPVLSRLSLLGDD